VEERRKNFCAPTGNSNLKTTFAIRTTRYRRFYRHEASLLRRAKTTVALQTPHTERLRRAAFYAMAVKGGIDVYEIFTTGDICTGFFDGDWTRKLRNPTYYMDDTLAGEDFIDHFALVQAMALEGSTGTWEKVEEDTAEMRSVFSSKMVGYFEIPPRSRTGAKAWFNWPFRLMPGATTSR